MPREEELKNVPADKVEAKIQDYKDAGATDVKAIKQADGKFTIIATFADNGNVDEAGGKPASAPKPTQASGRRKVPES